MPIEHVGPMADGSEQPRHAWDVAFARLTESAPLATGLAYGSMAMFIYASLWPLGYADTLPPPGSLIIGIVLGLVSLVADVPAIRRGNALAILAVDQGRNEVPTDKALASRWLHEHGDADAFLRARAALTADDPVAWAEARATLLPATDEQRLLLTLLDASANRGAATAPYLEAATARARALPDGRARRDGLLLIGVLRAEADVLAGVDPRPAFDAWLRVIGRLPIVRESVVPTLSGLLIPALALVFALASLGTNGFGFGIGS
jgi:hypothetical protein